MGRSINDIIQSCKDEQIEEKYDKYKPNDAIKNTLKFLTDHNFGRWHFAKANFGENFKWSQFDTSEPKYHLIQYQKHFTFQDVENFKGINYGQFEFGAEHYCVISVPVRRGMKTIHVLPMTSLKNKQPSEKWDIVISPSEYQFLSHDTIIHVGRVQEIGLERFLLNDMKRTLLKPSTRQPYVLLNKHIAKSKNILRKLFDLE
jgi:hypothetical protein